MTSDSKAKGIPEYRLFFACRQDNPRKGHCKTQDVKDT